MNPSGSSKPTEGRPTRSPTRDVFKADDSEGFVRRLAAEADLTIVCPEATG